jgi:hypothetical protein
MTDRRYKGIKQDSVNIQCNKHQSIFLNKIERLTMVNWFFLVCGYGGGKSLCDVLIILKIYEQYNGHFLTVLIAGLNAKRLRQTILQDLQTFLLRTKIPFTYNKTEGELRIGTILFLIASLDNPETLVGFNCVHGDSKVHLLSGDRKIKDVRAGDMVLTREGYRAVLKVWKNERRGRRLVNYCGGVITEDHKVLTGSGFVPVGDLTEMDVPVILKTGRPYPDPVRYEEEDWVYDLQVDGKHEYALSSGAIIHNSSISICDELDVLPTEKSLECIKKIQERNRVILPDGRSPYVVVTTTANGLKGTYLTVESFKQKLIPYCLVRGSTEDNPFFDRNTLASLMALYSEAEKEAFIRGKFVNLAVGRVYPEFDDKKHVYMNFPIKDSDELVIGADSNAGFNSNAVLTVHGDRVYVVDEFRCNVAGDVPRIARGRYANNKVVLIPDASSKEIMRGYIEEVEEADVDMKFMIKNPSITERALVVNKMLRLGKLVVLQRCTGIIQGLKVRGFDDNGMPSKGTGEHAVDHYLDSLEYALEYIVHRNSAFETVLALLQFQGGKDNYKLIGMDKFKQYVNHKSMKNGDLDD